MFDDLRKTLKKIRGDYSKNQTTSIGRGRNVVRGNLYYILVGILFAGLFGVIQAKDAGLLLIYGSAPFVLDSSLMLEAVTILSRFAPRITFIFEFGFEAVTIGIGLSFAAVIIIYRFVGAISMGIPYYKSLKKDDD